MVVKESEFHTDAFIWPTSAENTISDKIGYFYLIFLMSATGSYPPDSPWNKWNEVDATTFVHRGYQNQTKMKVTSCYFKYQDLANI